MTTGFLVDTDVLSAGSPSKARPETSLIEWMDRNSAKLYLSVIMITEVEDGIAKSAREGATRKAAKLRDWLETLIHLYRSRILPFDLDAARIAGSLSDQARGRGHTAGFGDLAIAAIARNHGLTILTRNTKHFA
ncbi:MAG: PIN domain-containing protein, partial [Proteobacteria bacterium]|nr:PIN domain-containing protein [Pseudomonadota bacterium]